jgi:UDP-N-acetylmuramate--alanine ligase
MSESIEEILSRKGAWLYFIGIKGTGMCALAELLHNAGARVSGSDCAEVFYTDRILKDLGIPYVETFDKDHIDAGIELVIHSAAYSLETNPEMAEARRRGLPLVKYTDALGAYSTLFDACGIAGVHGKTTTTAMTGTLFRAAGLPAKVLAGSAVSAFGGRSTLDLGAKYFAAETCEYRRHFLSFHPRRIILTSVESDHQDYYPDYKAIRRAFLEYCKKLPQDGELIYCADDPGASEVAAELRAESWAGKLIPYGFKAQGDFRISSYTVADERIRMSLAGFPGALKLRIPGRHSALNAAAALALTDTLVKKEGGWDEARRERVQEALEAFQGSKRRSEILGEAGGILFMDDYGHHPTAVKTTLEGLKDFYPQRRLVLSFMSHTYTRTGALLDEFAASFEKADLLILHKIYASAREKPAMDGGKRLEERLLEKTRALRDGVYYFEEPLDAVDLLTKELRPGDLFLTMGAGDNWKLGAVLFAAYQGAASASTRLR